MTNRAHRDDGRVSARTDESLARAAALGDRVAFDELVRRTMPSLLGYTRRMVADRQAAEDAAQETLIAAWKGLPRFGFRSSFRTWVFGIAHRKIVDQRRRHVEYTGHDDAFDMLEAEAPGPGEVAEGASMLMALRYELAQLPPVTRAVWWLREMEDLSHPEIAHILDISPGSVRGRLQRARRELAERMEPWRPVGGSDGRGAGRTGSHERGRAGGPATRGGRAEAADRRTGGQP
ncbi:RNA polymerase sigma factor [Williamsia sterculiae]|uniref:RNA polymerase sigma-70 factor, ECF subfamily n=1 Tax=Williamsia sterculiae TaxID=1344003 RepID=A0A1N7HCC9_9NOCA|nr:sigma-70 family RNA polymerase sigma factor [Williamsia sterculiae]SIS22462.1 RNA polymerase sigma-70 factor, ECF subfamily [Williamsia sterculiae]